MTQLCEILEWRSILDFSAPPGLEILIRCNFTSASDPAY